MRRARMIGALAATGLAVGACAVLAVAESPRFPPPDRPVAPIITPGYSTEEARDRAGEAVRVMDRLGLAPGMRVADVGAGDGYYTVRVARRLGPRATIYAQDVERPYLDRLAARLARDGITGVTLVHGTPRDPRLPRRSVDVAILAHMYHEIENPYEFLYRLADALAAGARVAVVDVDTLTQAHGTPPALLRCEMGAVGYRQIDFTSLAPADGYLAVFVPPAKLPDPEAIRPCSQDHGGLDGPQAPTRSAPSRETRDGPRWRDSFTGSQETVPRSTEPR